MFRSGHIVVVAVTFLIGAPALPRRTVDEPERGRGSRGAL
jgi:hypothetical protein